MQDTFYCCGELEGKCLRLLRQGRFKFLKKLNKILILTFDLLNFVKKKIQTLPTDFLNIWTLISWDWLMIGVIFFYEKLSHLNCVLIGIIKFQNCLEVHVLVTVDNEMSCHMILGSFQRWPQNEKCSLICQCSILSEKTKVTQFARLCRIMACLQRMLFHFWTPASLFQSVIVK